MMVPPGLSLPSRSASSIILAAMRSLMEPPGFTYSSFTRTVALMPSVTWLSLISGVLPMRSRRTGRTSWVQTYRLARMRSSWQLSVRRLCGDAPAPAEELAELSSPRRHACRGRRNPRRRVPALVSFRELAGRTVPVLAFVLAMTVVTELVDDAGLFRVVTAASPRWAGAASSCCGSWCLPCPPSPPRSCRWIPPPCW